MNHPHRLLLALAGLCLPVFLPAAEKLDLTRTEPVPDNVQIPIQDFFRRAILTSPELNHAGTHVAALISADEDKYKLLTYEIASKKVDVLEGIGDKDIYSFDWLDDRHLLFRLSVQKLYGMGLNVAELDHLGSCYPVLQDCDAQLLSIPDKNRTHPLVWMRSEPDDHANYRDGGVVVLDSLVRSRKGFINWRSANMDWSAFQDMLENNDLHIRERTPGPKQDMTIGYQCDRFGELAYAFTDKDGFASLHRTEGGNWIKCPVNLDEVDVMGAGDENDQVLVLGPRKVGTPRALQFMKPSTGELGAVVLQDQNYDFDGWIFRDPKSKLIMGAVFDRDYPTVVWFNEGYKALQKVLNNFFPGMIVRINGCSESGEIFLVAVWSDRQPVTYYSVDLKNKQVGLIKNSKPWINPKRMRQMGVLKYKTRDGLKFDAYITMPEGASKESPAPLVVLPHGGPYVRDTWGYNGEVQFLASRGYAVLQPNYRGSTGYEYKTNIEDNYEFTKMSDDVTDAVQAAIKTGLVDPDRIAIMGGSFGGYLAISGVSHEPNLYRCAVSRVGVFDWAQMIKDAKYNQFDNPRYAYLMRRLGDPKKEKDKFEAISPINFVSQIKVPVFVSHGKEDTNVDVIQSKRLVSQLERYNIPHEVMMISDEGHGNAHVEAQVRLMERVESFLKTNLAPRKPAGTAPAGAP
jgi:acetyl esterase/lipase